MSDLESVIAAYRSGLLSRAAFVRRFLTLGMGLAFIESLLGMPVKRVLAASISDPDAGPYAAAGAGRSGCLSLRLPVARFHAQSGAAHATRRHLYQRLGWSTRECDACQPRHHFDRRHPGAPGHHGILVARRHHQAGGLWGMVRRRAGRPARATTAIPRCHVDS